MWLSLSCSYAHTKYGSLVFLVLETTDWKLPEAAVHLDEQETLGDRKTKSLKKAYEWDFEALQQQLDRYRYIAHYVLGNENIEMITPSLYSQGDQKGSPLAGPWITASLIDQALRQGAANPMQTESGSCLIGRLGGPAWAWDKNVTQFCCSPARSFLLAG